MDYQKQLTAHADFVRTFNALRFDLAKECETLGALVEVQLDPSELSRKA